MNREKAETVLVAIKADLSRHDQKLWTNIAAVPSYTFTTYEGIRHVMGYGEPKIKESEGQVINCGTTACLAGHTAFIFAPVGTHFYKDSLRTGTDKPLISYEDFADQELELTSSEIAYLFSGDRTIDEIQEFIEASDERQSEILFEENHTDEYDG